MAYAASRYTRQSSRRSAPKFLKDIDKDTIDFIDNYDGSMKEPSLLPTSFSKRSGLRPTRASPLEWPARSAVLTLARL
jgi:hypothetical protein